MSAASGNADCRRNFMMRRLLAVLVLLGGIAGLGAAAGAADPSSVSGLFLTTQLSGADRERRRDHDDRPVGSQLQTAAAIAANYRFRRWRTAGRRQFSAAVSPIKAVSVVPDAEERLQLRLEPSQGVRPGDYKLHRRGQGRRPGQKLPIAVTVGEELPAKLKITTNIPGAARHLDHLVQVQGQRHQ